MPRASQFAKQSRERGLLLPCHTDDQCGSAGSAIHARSAHRCEGRGSRKHVSQGRRSLLRCSIPSSCGLTRRRVKPREFIALAGGAAVATPLATIAQQSTFRGPRLALSIMLRSWSTRSGFCPIWAPLRGGIPSSTSAPRLQLAGRFRSNATGRARACVTAGRRYRRLRYARDARCPANDVHNSNQ